MSDILADGAAWLDGMRRAHLSRHVSYKRDGVTSPCLATISSSVFETQTEMGVVERWESRDFIVSAGDMPMDYPERGDYITDTIGGVAVTYQVSAPRGAPVWKWADASRTAMRIHTTAIVDPSLPQE
jgi:hypothetical protein